MRLLVEIRLKPTRLIETSEDELDHVILGVLDSGLARLVGAREDTLDASINVRGSLSAGLGKATATGHSSGTAAAQASVSPL